MMRRAAARSVTALRRAARFALCGAASRVLRPAACFAMCGAAWLACSAATAPLRAQAPVSERDREVLRLEATPIGALPPLPLPMPASRDHHYWIARLQTGYRAGRGGADLLSGALGIDLQWRGGSVVGATAGYQARDCQLQETDCGGHLLFGAGARLNILAGGPGPLADLVRDYSGTTTLGIEASLGYAPDVLDGMDACTADIGLPVSSALFQKVRVVTFLTPGMVWDLGCGAEHGAPRSYRAAAGIGVLQLGHRGLDVFFGVHRIFRSGTGYHLGFSVNYVHLP